MSLEREAFLQITLWTGEGREVRIRFYAYGGLLLKAEGGVPLALFHPNPPRKAFPTDEAFAAYCLPRPCGQDLPLAVLSQMGRVLSSVIGLLPLSPKGRIELSKAPIPFPWKEVGGGLAFSPEALDLILPTPFARREEETALSISEDEPAIEVWRLVGEDPF